MDVKILLRLFCLFQIYSIGCAQPDFSVCGTVPSKFEHIIGDEQITGDWPWMASFGFEGEDKKWIHKCGATLIDSQHFITAAHCIRKSQPSWKIKTGINQLNSNGPERPSSVVLDIESKIIHPRYDNRTAYFDIGVIKTKTVEFQEFLRPVCLPKEPSADPDKYKNNKVTLTGWGKSNSDGNLSNDLLRVELQVFPKKRCNLSHEPFLADKNVKDYIPRLFEAQLMCAGDTLVSKGSCHGDSGGPLMYLDTEEVDEKYVQIGTVAGGIGGCGNRNLPSIFVRLDDPLIFGFLNSARTVYSKVLVALGSNHGFFDPIADVEIIDLLSSETTCQKLENFPYENSEASGGLDFQDKPLICGGNNNGSACHLYEDGTWKRSDSLKQGRDGFAMTKSPFQDGSSKLFLTGGQEEESDENLSSSEVLTENGWQVSVPLPVTISQHCMVTVNSTSVMVIGGKQNGQLSGRSFLFNSETHIWTEGPTLNTPRFYHSCGSIRKNNQTEDKSLIAVGGWDGSSTLSSVEVLDLDSNAWRRGPDLPFAIDAAAMVEDPSGGVVLIGGEGDVIGDLDTLYRLPHAGSDATWELMSQKLKTKRYYHTAFLIPDEIAACN